MAQTSIKLTVKAPSGVKITRALKASATAAAQDIITSELQFTALSKQLADSGVYISADELAQRAAGGRPTKTKKAAKAVTRGRRKRKRVVLTDAQRKSAVSDLRGGATIASVAKTYGCSPQTIMGLKKAAGLVKKKAAKKKAATKKKAAKKK
jgi:hypothetical protein